MLEITRYMCLGIIKIQGWKKGGEIRWASHVCRLFTNTGTLYLHSKKILLLYPTFMSITLKKFSKPANKYHKVIT